MLAKRDVLVLQVVVSFVVGLAGWPAQAKYSGGSGTAEDPYRIASKKDLLALAAETKDYGAHILLTADMDLSGQTFGMALIAPATETGPHLEFEATPFTGVFNGDGHKITGLTINDQNRESGYLALFGCVARGGSVKNLELERVSIINAGMGAYLGGLVGRNDAGTITNCGVNGTVDGGDDSAAVGALVGWNDPGGKIIDCRATSEVTFGTNYVGGLVGYNAPGATIAGCEVASIMPNRDTRGPLLLAGGLVGKNDGLVKHCRAKADVSAEYFIVGGLAGQNFGMIVDCSATGDVGAERGVGSAGGLVGGNAEGAIIANCTASGTVTCGNDGGSVGGLAGGNDGAITRCWATGDFAGEAFDGGGLVGKNGFHGTIDNSYATGSVTGPWAGAGGLTGYNKGMITNCHAVGQVSGTGDVGGLVGLPGAKELPVNSFWDVQTSGQSQSKGGAGKTTAQMQSAQTFLDASWDFDDVWNIVEGETYPFLRLGLVADLTCDGRVDLRDYARFAANWSKTCSYTKPKSPTVMCPLAGDLTGDREVNTQDLALMSAQWLEKR